MPLLHSGAGGVAGGRIWLNGQLQGKGKLKELLQDETKDEVTGDEQAVRPGHLLAAPMLQASSRTRGVVGR